jgi:hypothetical protein
VGEWVAYVMATVLLFVAVTFGVSLVQTQGASAQLARIAQLTAQEMAVEGGYTQTVQQTLIAQLQQNGFDPVQAGVTVTPAGQRAAYGQVVGIRIAYPVPVRIVDVAPFTVAVQASAAAVSAYIPGSAASADPVIAPGAGTPDLQGAPVTGRAVWVGP